MKKRTRIKKQVKQKGGDPKYYASCYGKIRHSKESAKAKALSTQRAYSCKYCPWWHLGRKKGFSFKKK